MPKTWLIGESNPYGADPHHALYPYPPGCSGARLCRFLGLTEDEYLGRFERQNLLACDKWSVPLARQAARVLMGQFHEGDRVVLLGAKVCAAFGHKFEILTVHDREFDRPPTDDSGLALDLRTRLLVWLEDPPIRFKILIAPHPSGMNRAWSDQELPARLRAAIAELERA